MATLPIPGSDLSLLAVSSDLINTSGRIIYRNDSLFRTMDLRFDLGEIEVRSGRWEFPSVISVEPGFAYSKVALAHDLTKASTGRALFLASIPHINQVLSVKHFDTEKACWGPLTKIVNGQGNQIMTHKLSNLAATQGGHAGKLQLQLYFINENDNLVELVGTSTAAGYTWEVSGIVASDVSPESHLAVVCRDKSTTYVHYQTASGTLAVATRTGKDWTSSGDIQQHAPGTPLGISITAEHPPMCYFADVDSVYAQPMSPFFPSPTPVKVGSHIPRSNIGAISFPGNMGPDFPSNTAHVLSVSALDNSRVLLERVHTSMTWPESSPKWEIPAGVIPTPPIS